MPNWLFLMFALFAVAPAVHAEIVVHDDAGRTVRLAAPARRIVSLAPNITEDLYAAGAGHSLVGTVAYSDYPPAAKRLPRVGNASRIDLESILAERPDLVIAWGGGTPAADLAKLERLGLTLFVSEPRRLGDIATTLERFGALGGTRAIADAAAHRFSARLAKLRARFAGRSPVRSFYQVWYPPLVTIGGGQLITAAMRLCGAKNIFAGLRQPAPTVSVEAVLAANPEAIIAGTDDHARPLKLWRRWPDLTATARGNLFYIPSDLITRATPRMLNGIERLCGQMATARSRRPHQAGTN